ncbi:hypothetical protein [Mycoplasma anserisalpingitidis]|uniref:hypothetical protein n=1 Tax=Mycoplasma anserisalpingitidis TaxID=519450 RepID=UPI0011B15DB7|nr:hypothetical protein [Mycoplasma anserisalpingitidis]QDY87939.1 hypothetical protein FOY45_03380 [Mycoplasma anserisalpingitidis]
MKKRKFAIYPLLFTSAALGITVISLHDKIEVKIEKDKQDKINKYDEILKEKDDFVNSLTDGNSSNIKSEIEYKFNNLPSKEELKDKTNEEIENSINEAEKILNEYKDKVQNNSSDHSNDETKSNKCQELKDKIDQIKKHITENSGNNNDPAKKEIIKELEDFITEIEGKEKQLSDEEIDNKIKELDTIVHNTKEKLEQFDRDKQDKINKYDEVLKEKDDFVNSLTDENSSNIKSEIEDKFNNLPSKEELKDKTIEEIENSINEAEKILNEYKDKVQNNSSNHSNDETKSNKFQELKDKIDQIKKVIIENSDNNNDPTKKEIIKELEDFITEIEGKEEQLSDEEIDNKINELDTIVHNTNEKLKQFDKDKQDKINKYDEILKEKDDFVNSLTDENSSNIKNEIEDKFNNLPSKEELKDKTNEEIENSINEAKKILNEYKDKVQNNSSDHSNDETKSNKFQELKDKIDQIKKDITENIDNNNDPTKKEIIKELEDFITEIEGKEKQLSDEEIDNKIKELDTIVHNTKEKLEQFDKDKQDKINKYDEVLKEKDDFVNSLTDGNSSNIKNEIEDKFNNLPSKEELKDKTNEEIENYINEAEKILNEYKDKVQNNSSDHSNDETKSNKFQELKDKIDQIKKDITENNDNNNDPTKKEIIKELEDFITEIEGKEEQLSDEEIDNKIKELDTIVHNTNEKLEQFEKENFYMKKLEFDKYILNIEKEDVFTHELFKDLRVIFLEKLEFYKKLSFITSKQIEFFLNDINSWYEMIKSERNSIVIEDIKKISDEGISPKAHEIRSFMNSIMFAGKIFDIQYEMEQKYNADLDNLDLLFDYRNVFLRIDENCSTFIEIVKPIINDIFFPSNHYIVTSWFNDNSKQLNSSEWWLYISDFLDKWRSEIDYTQENDVFKNNLIKKLSEFRNYINQLIIPEYQRYLEIIPSTYYWKYKIENPTEDEKRTIIEVEEMWNDKPSEVNNSNLNNVTEFLVNLNSKISSIYENRITSLIKKIEAENIDPNKYPELFKYVNKFNTRNKFIGFDELRLLQFYIIEEYSKVLKN